MRLAVSAGLGEVRASLYQRVQLGVRALNWFWLFRKVSDVLVVRNLILKRRESSPCVRSTVIGLVVPALRKG